MMPRNAKPRNARKKTAAPGSKGLSCLGKKLSASDAADAEALVDSRNDSLASMRKLGDELVLFAVERGLGPEAVRNLQAMDARAFSL